MMETSFTIIDGTIDRQRVPAYGFRKKCQRLFRHKAAAIRITGKSDAIVSGNIFNGAAVFFATESSSFVRISKFVFL
jgi:hypothetical protein